MPLALLITDNSKARSGAGQPRNYSQGELDAASFNRKHFIMWFLYTA